MFRIKICGITTVADALATVSAGADAIGLNFCEQSKRRVDVGVAQEIATAVASRVQVAGVFVNAPPEEIRRVHEAVGLNLVQLHGDEPAEIYGELADLAIVQAVRARPGWRAALRERLESLPQASWPQAVLVDGYKPGEYGGTGEVIDWESLTSTQAEWGKIPLVLAGGLTPSNVAAAISVARPHAVDTASGVESAPGKKDEALVRAFIAAARNAFEATA